MTADSLAPGEQIAGWVIQRPLGSGGMGAVYLAQHPRLPRLDALKVLNQSLASDSTFRRRFLQESEAICGLVHPHVVAVYDRGEHEGRLYFAMQYVSGGDLRARLEGPDGVSLGSSLQIAEQIASALDAAHESGLVHRDVKPENVLLLPSSPERPYAVLADFGISRVGDKGGALTATGQIVATPGYMAPEIARGEQPDGRADQYALACLLFELITGRVPFPRDTPLSAMFAHVNEPVEAATEDPKLPGPLVPVFTRALAKDPAQRFPSCSEMVQAAAAAQGTTRSESTGTTVRVNQPQEQAARGQPAFLPRTVHRWIRGPRAAISVGVVAVLVVGLVLGLDTSKKSAKAAQPGSAIPSSVGYTPVLQSRTCNTEVAAQIPGAVCKTLVVPQDRANPHNGQPVKLALTVAPARGAPTSDPVVQLGGFESLSTSPVRDHAEEISVATRGNAPSQPSLTCPEYSTAFGHALTKPATDSAALKNQTAALNTCYARLRSGGVDPNNFNFSADADDVLDVMRAMRLARVNLVSGYGYTISALRVLETAPGAVKSLTLLNPALPGRSQFSDPTAFLSEAFDRYSNLCAADRECAALGDLRTAYESTFAALQAKPVLGLGDDGIDKHAVLLDGSNLAIAVAQSLYDTDALPLLATTISQKITPASRDAAAGQVLQWNAEGLQPDFAWGAEFSRQCSYGVHTIISAHEISSQARPEFSGLDHANIEQICRAWPVKSLPNFAFGSLPSFNVPTLILQGGLASDRSLDWGSQLKSHFLNRATVMTFATMSFSVFDDGPACLAAFRRQLTAQQTLPDGAGKCAEQSPPIHFVVPAK